MARRAALRSVDRLGDERGDGRAWEQAAEQESLLSSRSSVNTAFTWSRSASTWRSRTAVAFASSAQGPIGMFALR